MKREKRLTKRERKALAGGPQAATHDHEHQHIHCIACGRHLDAEEFDEPATAMVVVCEHKSSFPCCKGCEAQARVLVEAHDRSGKPVQAASAWH